jgi:hypothetical protein
MQRNLIVTMIILNNYKLQTLVMTIVGPLLYATENYKLFRFLTTCGLVKLYAMQPSKL